MTVPATTRRAGPFTGNGVTTSFPFTFKVFAATDIQFVTADADGLETLRVLGSDYSVTLNPDQDASPGGSVTYPLSGTPLASGHTAAISGAVEYTQELDLPGGGSFSPTALENALDRTTMQIQQLAEEVGRSLTLPVTAASTDSELPAPEAGKVIAWNSTGTGLVNVDSGDIASVVVAGTSYTDIFDGTGAQTAFTLTSDPGSVNALDIAISGVSQANGVDFTVSGTTLTFTSAPPAGTDNVVVRYVAALPVGTTNAQDVVFEPAGTGAVDRTVQAKLREVSVSITDFVGADPTGATSSAAALSAANTALSGGGTIHIPDGTFLISSSVSLNSGIRIVGNGPTSIIKGGVSSFITATSKSDIEIRSVKFLSDNYRVRFDLCTDVRLIDCYADGTRATTNVTNQGFWFSGCDDVLIENPYFVDYRDAIYFDTSGTTPCGTATVRGGQIWQSKHGSSINYPTGVYGVDIRKMYVEGVTFKNIKASSDSVSGGTGYGVYEGDGTDGNLEIVRVSDCKFIDDDGYTTRPMIGCLITLAESGVVDGCYFQGPAGGDYVGFIYGSRSQVIQNSIFDGAACQLDRLLTPNCWLVTGNLFKNITGRVLRVGPNSPGPDIITITGNTFRDCTHGAITVIYADFVHITSNAIYDCNTSGQTSDSYRGGINLDGPTQGLVATNLIANVTTGQMAYGVSAAASGSVYATDNKFSGMVTADTLNVIANDYSVGTFTPTVIGSGTAGTATYSAQFGKYTKIGRLVTCQIRLTWTGGTGAGNLKIAGLPFTSGNDNVYGTVDFGWISEVALTASNVATGYVDLGATTLNIYQYPVGGGTLAAVAYDGAGNIGATVTYMMA